MAELYEEEMAMGPLVRRLQCAVVRPAASIHGAVRAVVPTGVTVEQCGRLSAAGGLSYVYVTVKRGNATVRRGKPSVATSVFHVFQDPENAARTLLSIGALTRSRGPGSLLAELSGPDGSVPRTSAFIEPVVVVTGLEDADASVARAAKVLQRRLIWSSPEALLRSAACGYAGGLTLAAARIGQDDEFDRALPMIATGRSIDGGLTELDDAMGELFGQGCGGDHPWVARFVARGERVVFYGDHARQLMSRVS
jgi:hypothetical protein